MTADRPPLLIDFETRSDVNLKQTGVYPYALGRWTSVLCMGFAFGDDKPLVWWPGAPFPQAVIDHVAAGGEVQAWNMQFDRLIWNLTLRRMHPEVPALPIDQCRCLMATALAMGLPGSLERAAAALKIRVTKDKAGANALRYLWGPKGFAADGSPRFREDPVRHELMRRYCQHDVRLSQACRRFLRALTPEEMAVWRWDQRVNDRGFAVDPATVGRMQKIVDAEKARLNAELTAVTDGAVGATTEVARLTLWLQDQGVEVDSLNKLAVRKLLADETLPPHCRRAIEIRAEGAKASTAKLKALVGWRLGGGKDERPRVRGALQYHGAGTGRWAGRGPQPHNFPRAVLDAASFEDLERYSRDVEFLRVMHAPLLTYVSRGLRQTIVARSPRHRLLGGDFSQIEARDLAYLAGQKDVVEIFRSGKDVYRYDAAQVFGIDPDDVDSEQRQLGKVQRLALGYGMGDAKFQATAAYPYGVILTLSQAATYKAAWREANPHIVNFWHRCNDAAMAACDNPGQPYRAGPVVYAKVGLHMWCKLPSGRWLCYPFAQLEEDDRPGWEGSWGVTYWTWAPAKGGWIKQHGYGGLFVENIVQADARDVMVDRAMAAEAAGFPIILHVHDSVLTELPADEAEARRDEFERILTTVPRWLPGLPLAADVYLGERFSK